MALVLRSARERTLCRHCGSTDCAALSWTVPSAGIAMPGGWEASRNARVDLARND
jgi:hypothetical protein